MTCLRTTFAPTDVLCSCGREGFTNLTESYSLLTTVAGTGGLQDVDNSLTVVKQWIATNGVIDLATGFTQLGNLVVDAAGNVVVVDRGAHRVYRLDGEGAVTKLPSPAGGTS